MVHQTSVNDPYSASNGTRSSAAVGVRDGVGELVHDIVSLGELQAELLAVDTRESLEKARTPVVFLAVGSILALASLPVLLMSAGQGIAHLLAWDNLAALAVGYLISGGVALLLAGVLLMLAVSRFGVIFSSFTRSRTELAENIRWIKYALTKGRRPPR